MTDFDLLNKTELKIKSILLDNANLTDIAATAADTLGLEHDDVLVVDYRDGILVLDILNNCVNAYNIVGKKKSLLDNLGKLSGVSISGTTDVVSGGMLGWIALDETAATGSLQKSEKMVSDILTNISKRVIVFSSGAEVANKKIEDTNTPAIKKCLEAEGYKVFSGEVLKDDKLFIAAKLRESADLGGYGVIITTGGVGAEDKDHTVEAIKLIDPEAATPYICHFKIGTDRHVKDGVKIAVGEYNDTRIIALPGPNDEVNASLMPMIDGLKIKTGKQDLAENIAANLRQILRRKMNHNHKKGEHWHEGWSTTRPSLMKAVARAANDVKPFDPPGAIEVVDKKACVDEAKCLACTKCWHLCPEHAVTMVERDEELIIGVDFDDVDPLAIEELCKKAHFFPEQFVCACTLTLAKEVAAAIIMGAETPEQVTVMTGVRSGCAIYCTAGILRMLKAHGVEIQEPGNHRWYDLSLSLWDIADEMADKYPGYYLKEDKAEFNG